MAGRRSLDWIGVEDVRKLNMIIDLYKNYIIENLFQKEGYEFDERFREGNKIILVYKRR